MLMASLPTGAPNAAEVGKNCIFWPTEVSGSDALLNLCQSATVVHIHDGGLAEEYAVSSTMLVVVKVH